MIKKRFGICVPVYGRSYAPKQAQLDFEVVKRIAVHADREGYYWIRVPDHLVNPTGSYPGNERRDRWNQGALEAWTTLTSLSMVTSQVRLSNIVLDNLMRTPSVLAKMAATLDVISGGRLILALGAGWLGGELEAYGIAWKTYRTRLGMLKESIQLIKKLWTEEETTFRGKYYRLNKAVLYPKPVQTPHPPIWVGGASENIMKIAAQEADGWDIGAPMGVVKQRIQQLEDYCAEIGRNKETLTISRQVTPFLGRTMEEAEKIARIWAEFAAVELKDLISGGQAWIGAPEDIAHEAEKTFEAGVDIISLIVPQDIEYLERLTETISCNLKCYIE